MGRRIIGEESQKLGRRRRRFKGVEGGLQGRGSIRGLVPKKQGGQTGTKASA